MLDALPSNEQGNLLRKAIAEQIESWKSMTQGGSDDDLHDPDALFPEIPGSDSGIIKALSSSSTFRFPKDPKTFCNKFKHRHPDLWARLVADRPKGELGAIALVTRGLKKYDPEIVYLKLKKQLPSLPEPWPADPDEFVARFKLEHAKLWRRLVAAEKRYGEHGAFNCLKHALRDVKDPNKVRRMAIRQLRQLPDPG